MSVELTQVIDSLFKTSPSAELGQISKDISTILDVNQSTINASIDKFVLENGVIVAGNQIASKWNKHDKSTKYVDYVDKKIFNVDFKTRKAIDIENYVEDIEYPANFDALVEELQAYGGDHYPSTFAMNVIPKDGLRILIYGQRVNQENFYSGTWSSNYLIKNGTLKGEVKLDIHYYEEGNVRLNFVENFEESLASNSNIVKAIGNIEHKLSIKVIESFNDLNQRTFKNLRRLLPITRSKINWGNAIGNYRLGSDVINKQ